MSSPAEGISARQIRKIPFLFENFPPSAANFAITWREEAAVAAFQTVGVHEQGTALGFQTLDKQLSPQSKTLHSYFFINVDLTSVSTCKLL